MAGFADGVVRLLALNKVDPSQLRTKKSKQKFELNLEQVFKPHTKAVNVMAIDEQGELLATGVILDRLLFLYSRVDENRKSDIYLWWTLL